MAEKAATKPSAPPAVPLPTAQPDFDAILNLNLDDLNITTNQEEEVDFEGIEEDMKLLKDNNPEVLKKFYEGEDLREYITKMESNLHEVETGTILDYIKEGKTIASLYNQITACDTILEGMETLLIKFQNDINTIGTQIKTLQDECMAKQIKINNRAAVEERIAKFVEGVTVPDQLAQSISFAEVNDAYLEYMVEFNKRLTYLENQKSTIGAPLLAVQDVEPRIATLRDRCVGKIKAFILNHMQGCRSMGDVKAQHGVLIKYNYLFQFLFKHGPVIANEVKVAYTDILGKLYLAYFRNMVTIGSRLLYDVANKNDLIGVEESKNISFLTGKKTIKHKTSVFAMGIRQRIIDELETFQGNPEMFNSQDKQPYEFFFRNVLYILLDKATDEVKFIQDFFLFAEPTELSEDIFGKALAVIDENLDGFLSNTYDAVQMLLLVVVTQKCKHIMAKRLVTVLDSFLDSVYLRLTNTFFRIFDLNLQSVKNAMLKDLNSKDLDLRPHYVTRRYAEFTVSLLYLSTKHADYMGSPKFIAKLNQNLARLREEMEKLLVRLADTRYKDWKSKTIFLINNYDLILTTYAEREIVSSDSQQFQKLLDIKTNDYAQEELRNSFGNLLKFVKENAQYVKEKDEVKESSNNNTAAPATASAPANPATPAKPEAKVEEKKIAAKEEDVDLLLKEFNNNWKVELEKINSTIMKQFSNYKYGMKLFQQIMEQLLDAYTIFIKVIRKYYNNLRTKKHFTPETEITYEMKKLFVAFE